MANYYPVPRRKAAAYTVTFQIGQTSGHYAGYTSIRAARKAAREMALGNCPDGCTGRWQVTSADGAEVASGKVRS